MSEFCNFVAAPYIDALVSSLNSHFSDCAVKFLVSSCIFNPPYEETALPDYGNEELQVLVKFYEEEVTHKSTYDSEEVLAECRILNLKKAIMQKGKQTTPPNLQEVKMEMELSGAYTDIFQKCSSC